MTGAGRSRRVDGRRSSRFAIVVANDRLPGGGGSTVCHVSAQPRSPRGEDESAVDERLSWTTKSFRSDATSVGSTEEGAGVIRRFPPPFSPVASAGSAPVDAGLSARVLLSKKSASSIVRPRG